MASQHERNGTSLHERIRHDIEESVMSGAWHAGQRIPYEHELMERYSCSRMTVNKALGTLVERGLIERRKRAGSFVASPRFHRAALDLLDVRSEVLRKGDRYDFDLVKRIERRATASDRSNLDIGGGQVLDLTCLHFAAGKPFSLENRIINLQQVPEAAAADFEKEPPGAWLLTHVPWSDARHRISSVNADSAVATLMKMPISQACLVIERWTWRVSEKITYVQQVYPGDKHRLEAQFRP